MPITDITPYSAQFERTLVAGEPAWLRALREQAFARFMALGFPTTKQEDWRFTNVSPIADRAFRLSSGADGAFRPERLAPFRFGAHDVIEMVFVGGHFVPRLSRLDNLPAGVGVRSLADALRDGCAPVASRLGRHASFEHQPFAALNTAFVSDGALVEIAPNTVVTRPIHILFVAGSDGEVTYPRLLVLAGINSEVQIVESYVGIRDQGSGEASPRSPIPDPEASSFTNAVSEIVLADGAVVDHYRVQREATDSFHVSSTHVRLSHSSAFSSHAFSFGAAIARNDITALLAGEGGDCTLNGLYLAGGSQLTDTHSIIDHAQPHCGSREVYKGILDDRAHAVFNGRIIVRPDAQKTDSKQTNKTLLLSDDAQIDTKPQLEIFANDVKCTHGATVGQLSADALFYLQTRGIDRAEAQRMLVRAFAADITGLVKIDALRRYLDEVLVGTLAQSSGGKRRRDAKREEAAPAVEAEA